MPEEPPKSSKERPAWLKKILLGRRKPISELNDHETLDLIIERATKLTERLKNEPLARSIITQLIVIKIYIDTIKKTNSDFDLRNFDIHVTITIEGQEKKIHIINFLKLILNAKHNFTDLPPNYDPVIFALIHTFDAIKKNPAFLTKFQSAYNHYYKRQILIRTVKTEKEATKKYSLIHEFLLKETQIDIPLLENIFRNHFSGKPETEQRRTISKLIDLIESGKLITNDTIKEIIAKLSEATTSLSAMNIDVHTTTNDVDSPMPAQAINVADLVGHHLDFYAPTKIKNLPAFLATIKYIEESYTEAQKIKLVSILGKVNDSNRDRIYSAITSYAKTPDRLLYMLNGLI